MKIAQKVPRGCRSPPRGGSLRDGFQSWRGRTAAEGAQHSHMRYAKRGALSTPWADSTLSERGSQLFHRAKRCEQQCDNARHLYRLQRAAGEGTVDRIASRGADIACGWRRVVARGLY